MSESDSDELNFEHAVQQIRPVKNIEISAQFSPILQFPEAIDLPITKCQVSSSHKRRKSDKLADISKQAKEYFDLEAHDMATSKYSGTSNPIILSENIDKSIEMTDRISARKSRRSLHNIENEISTFAKKPSKNGEQICILSDNCHNPTNVRMLENQNTQNKMELIQKSATKYFPAFNSSRVTAHKEFSRLDHGERQHPPENIEKKGKSKTSKSKPNTQPECEVVDKIFGVSSDPSFLLEELSPFDSGSSEWGLTQNLPNIASAEERLWKQDRLFLTLGSSKKPSKTAVFEANAEINDTQQISKLNPKRETKIKAANCNKEFGHMKDESNVFFFQHYKDQSLLSTCRNCSKETDIDDDYQEFFSSDGILKCSVNAIKDDGLHKIASKNSLEPLSEKSDNKYKYHDLDTYIQKENKISDVIEATKPRTTKYKLMNALEPLSIESNIDKNFEIKMGDSDVNVNFSKTKIDEVGTSIIQNDSFPIGSSNEQSTDMVTSQTIIDEHNMQRVECDNETSLETFLTLPQRSLEMIMNREIQKSSTEECSEWKMNNKKVEILTEARNYFKYEEFKPQVTIISENCEKVEKTMKQSKGVETRMDEIPKSQQCNIDDMTTNAGCRRKVSLELPPNGVSKLEETVTFEDAQSTPLSSKTKTKKKHSHLRTATMPIKQYLHDLSTNSVVVSEISNGSNARNELLISNNKYEKNQELSKVVISPNNVLKMAESDKRAHVVQSTICITADNKVRKSEKTNTKNEKMATMGLCTKKRADNEIELLKKAVPFETNIYEDDHDESGKTTHLGEIIAKRINFELQDFEQASEYHLQPANIESPLKLTIEQGTRVLKQRLKGKNFKAAIGAKREKNVDMVRPQCVSEELGINGNESSLTSYTLEEGNNADLQIQNLSIRSIKKSKLLLKQKHAQPTFSIEKDTEDDQSGNVIHASNKNSTGIRYTNAAFEYSCFDEVGQQILTLDLPVNIEATELSSNFMKSKDEDQMEIYVQNEPMIQREKLPYLVQNNLEYEDQLEFYGNNFNTHVDNFNDQESSKHLRTPANIKDTNKQGSKIISEDELLNLTSEMSNYKLTPKVISFDKIESDWQEKIQEEPLLHNFQRDNKMSIMNTYVDKILSIEGENVYSGHSSCESILESTANDTRLKRWEEVDDEELLELATKVVIVQEKEAPNFLRSVMSPIGLLSNLELELEAKFKKRCMSPSKSQMSYLSYNEVHKYCCPEHGCRYKLLSYAIDGHPLSDGDINESTPIRGRQPLTRNIAPRNGPDTKTNRQLSYTKQSGEFMGMEESTSVGMIMTNVDSRPRSTNGKSCLLNY